MWEVGNGYNTYRIVAWSLSAYLSHYNGPVFSQCDRDQIPSLQHLVGGEDWRILTCLCDDHRMRIKLVSKTCWEFLLENNLISEFPRDSSASLSFDLGFMSELKCIRLSQILGLNNREKNIKWIYVKLSKQFETWWNFWHFPFDLRRPVMSVL